MIGKNDISGLKAGQGDTCILPTEASNVSGNSPTKSKTPPKKYKETLKRLNKGFQVEEGRALKWDILVAQMKRQGKTVTMLIDEAMDLIFSKYGNKKSI